MARQKTLYKLVGRYVRGNDTVYYGLISEDGKEVRYTEEQMAFAVGREQVINVRAQLYKDKVLFRGTDYDIRNLPTIQLNNSVTTKVDNNVTKKVSTNTMTKEVYTIICNNNNMGILEDYLFSCKYNDENNTMYVTEQYKPSYGSDLTQYFFGDDEKVQRFVLTDDNNYFYLKYVDTNEIIAKTKDKMLILNLLNITDKQIKSVVTLEDSLDFIKQSFSDFCGSADYAAITSAMRGEHYQGFDFSTALQLMELCIMEMKYVNITKNKSLDSTYKSYIFRRQGIQKGSIEDHSFKSTTTSLNVAKEYGKNGIILAIKNVKISDIINVQSVAGYDKDFIYYEHELLLRDFSILHIENQIGVIANIPVYSARLEMPDYNTRLKMILKQFTDAYGKNVQFEVIKIILSNLKLLCDITIHWDSIVLEALNGKFVNIAFTDDKNTITIDDITYNNYDVINVLRNKLI